VHAAAIVSSFLHGCN